MLAPAPQVLEDVLLLATRLLQRVRQDRQAVEGSFLIDGFRKLLHGRGEASGVKCNGAERVANNLSKQSCLRCLLLSCRQVSLFLSFHFFIYNVPGGTR